MKRVMLLLSVVFLYIACKKNVANTPVNQLDCSSIDSRFAVKIFPIIQGSCATNSGCHGNGSINGPGALTSFIQISNAAMTIKDAVASGRMPKGGSLSTQDKNAIACWINSGSPNN